LDGNVLVVSKPTPEASRDHLNGDGVIHVTGFVAMLEQEVPDLKRFFAFAVAAVSRTRLEIGNSPSELCHGRPPIRNARVNLCTRTKDVGLGFSSKS
jgi:hypothetical protein